MTRLVLVDDSELIRRGLRLLLSTADDMEVIGEAADGRQALVVLAHERPDIVLVDVKMPGMGGLELSQQVHDRWPGLPVILLTTFDDPVTVAAAVHAGVAGFLLKDSSTDDLVAAIHQVENGGLALDPRIARAAVQGPITADPLARLTPAERRVAGLVSRGSTNAEIARELFLTEGTVKNHVSALLRKLEQRDRTGLALFLNGSGPWESAAARTLRTVRPAPEAHASGRRP